MMGVLGDQNREIIIWYSGFVPCTRICNKIAIHSIKNDGPILIPILTVSGRQQLSLNDCQIICLLR